MGGGRCAAINPGHVMKITRNRPRTQSGGALTACLAALFALFVSAATASAQTRVVIGTPGSINDASLAVHIAIEKGFYRDAGVAVDVVDFKGGAPAVQALVGSGINYCICAPEHVIRLRNRGVDGVVAFAFDTRHTYVLLTKDGSPIKQFADLKGKRVGITSSGSLTENLVRLEGKRAGLDAGKDLEIVGAGVGAAQKAALDTGRIEAGMFGNLDALQLAGQGYRPVFDWRTQVVPSLALVARESWLKENATAARGVAEATLKAQKLIIADKAIAIEGLKTIYPTLPAAVIEQVATSLQHPRLSADGLFTREAFDRLQDDLVEIEPDLKRVPYSVGVPGLYLTKPAS
jgi:NitT/TauT family transport system substrate-binding protein